MIKNAVCDIHARWIYPCLLVVLAAIVGLPTEARASYICPTGPGPGEVQLGTTGGSNGVAAMPVCEEDINYSDDTSDGSDTAPEPRRDPLQTSIGGIVAALEALGMGHDRSDKFMNDPKNREYKEMTNGTWQHFQNSKNPRPGEYCDALYTNLKGAVSVSGPGGDYKGAMMTFWGLDIPRPDSASTIKVTLDQADGKPQTVSAFNYSMPDGKIGAISLAVPTIQALLDNMEDNQTFDIAIDGKSVIHLEWQHGLEARDKLRRCVNAER